MGAKKNYWSYERAVEVVRAENIQSQVQYHRWWDKNTPKLLPRNPHKVYKEWTTWGGFLGNNNSFTNNVPKKFRSYDEALVYSRNSAIKTFHEWMAHNHPPDIPVRPDLYYKEWCGWDYFLGKGKNKASHVVQAAKTIEQLNVLLVALPPDSDNTIIHISIQPGVAKCKEFLTSNHMRFIKAFKMEPGYDWRSVVQVHCTDYGNGEWYCTNVHQLLFDINLEWIN